MHTAKTPPVEITLRSLTRYIVIATALATALLSVPIFTGLPTEIFLLIAMYVVLLGGAVIVARRSGPGGIRRLFSGLLHWRIGWVNWAVVVLAMPVATIAVAVMAGAYTPPPDGWVNVAGDYLFQTFIFGAVLLNLPEETVWQGMVQRNLTRRFGLLRAAAITAIPFAILHVPISYAAGETGRESLLAIAMMTAVAPLMRYVVGRTDRATGGSLLAVGVFHAGFNASGKLAIVTDWWWYAVALGVVAAALLTVDVVRARIGGTGLYTSQKLPAPATEFATPA